MISFDAEKEQQVQPVVSIKVIRIGGAGGNTVNSIIYSGISGIECLVVNTDAQSLKTFRAPVKIQIGVKATKGLGAGANPELGKRAAQEDLDKIMEELTSADIVFLTGGMGGGIGSGALPVVARALREQGILSIAVVTRPFSFEGKTSLQNKLMQQCIIEKRSDTLIIIPNQRLLDVVGKDVSMIDAFAMINDVLSQSVCSILDIITRSGHINVDFADVKAIMKDMGARSHGNWHCIRRRPCDQGYPTGHFFTAFRKYEYHRSSGSIIEYHRRSYLGLHDN
jgi:cell division protein FtsZ